VILRAVAVAICVAAATAAFASSAETPLRLDVPAIRQAPERCGPAALSMVLRFYGAPPSAVAEAERAYDPAIRGALITDLIAAAQRAGFRASAETPDEAGLKALLRERVPPVLLYERGVGPISRGHYGVLVGWDPDRNDYVVNDGRSRPKRMGRDDLMRRWHAAGGQALVVRPSSP
jgi:ABC-type bacteriocin/lantibiotic exporter with double-glycine peptidase domain